MIELQITEFLSDTSLKSILSHYWLDENEQKFSFSNLERGKHLVNLKLIENHRNMILEVEKWDTSRITIKRNEEIEVLGKTHGFGWRRVMRDVYGIKKEFSK